MGADSSSSARAALLSAAHALVFRDSTPRLRQLFPVTALLDEERARRVLQLAAVVGDVDERALIARGAITRLPPPARPAAAAELVAALDATDWRDWPVAMALLGDFVTVETLPNFLEAVAKPDDPVLSALGFAAVTLEADSVDVVEELYARVAGLAAGEPLAIGLVAMTIAFDRPAWSGVVQRHRPALALLTMRIGGGPFQRAAVKAVDEVWPVDVDARWEVLERIIADAPGKLANLARLRWALGRGPSPSEDAAVPELLRVLAAASEAQRTDVIDDLLWSVAVAEARGRPRHRGARPAPVEAIVAVEPALELPEIEAVIVDAADILLPRRSVREAAPRFDDAPGAAPYAPAPDFGAGAEGDDIFSEREPADVPVVPDADGAPIATLPDDFLSPYFARTPTGRVIAPPAAPRRFYPLIRCAEEIVVNEEFEVHIGLAERAQPGTAGGAMRVPEGATLDMVIDTRGLVVVAGSARAHLTVVPGAPPPAPISLTLRAPAEEKAVELRVFYSIDGVQIGTGTRAISFVANLDAAPRDGGSAPAGGFEITPAEHLAVDLLIRIVKRPTAPILEWTFDASDPDIRALAHGEPIETAVPDDTASIAETLVRAIDGLEGAPGVVSELKGQGRVIAKMMPPLIFDLLAAARKVSPSPTLLILTDNVHVPWELATVPDDKRDPLTPSHLCTQARVGRWLLTDYESNERQFPPREITFRTVDVFASGYVNSPDQLPNAPEEANDLEAEFGATKYDATRANIMRRVQADPVADAIHFAMHGDYSSGGRRGLVTTEDDIVSPELLGAEKLHGSPFVFLNACRVAATTIRLGVHAGVAPALVSVGAAAVLAPMWSVNDERARDYAHEFYARAKADGSAIDFVNEWMRKLGPSGGDSVFWVAYQYYGHPALRLRWEA